MKGLLLKDWYQVRTSMKTMYLTVAFVLVILFCLVFRPITLTSFFV